MESLVLGEQSTSQHRIRIVRDSGPGQRQGKHADHREQSGHHPWSRRRETA